MKIGSNKGFTLIELLIVIAIIGILAVALLPTVLGAPAKGRDAARKANLSAAVTAIEAANLDLGSYPTGQMCLDTTAGTWGTRLKYFQGGAPAMDPLGANGPNFGKTNCGRGEMLYNQSSGGASGKNYALVSYIELPENANALWENGVAAAADYAIPATKPTSCVAFSSTTPFAPVDAQSCVYVLQK